ncbi:3907_t:CDS:10 [Diversispora eburnea]|uniref:3907_t:CDS:1 n=1 Tax=Diversispora eburnea TaxID=1213867 RepID=A0A9N8ZRW7_9GLOM|nr:3907_t:CDS:10 [Diversispora eburnea]
MLEILEIYQKCTNTLVTPTPISSDSDPSHDEPMLYVILFFIVIGFFGGICWIFCCGTCVGRDFLKFCCGELYKNINDCDNFGNSFNNNFDDNNRGRNYKYKSTARDEEEWEMLEEMRSTDPLMDAKFHPLRRIVLKSGLKLGQISKLLLFLDNNKRKATKVEELEKSLKTFSEWFPKTSCIFRKFEKSSIPPPGVLTPYNSELLELLDEPKITKEHYKVKQVKTENDQGDGDELPKYENVKNDLLLERGSSIKGTMERQLTEYQYVCQHLTDNTLVAKNFYSKDRKMKEKITTEATLNMANKRLDLATEIIHKNVFDHLEKEENNENENDEQNEAKSSILPIKVYNNSKIHKLKRKMKKASKYVWRRKLLKPGNLKFISNLTYIEQDTTEVFEIVNRIRLVSYLKEFSDCQGLASLERKWPTFLPSDILDKRLRYILWAFELIKWYCAMAGWYFSQGDEKTMDQNTVSISTSWDSGFGNYHEVENKNNREDLDVLLKGFSTMSAMQALTLPEEAKKRIGDLEFFGIRGIGNHF